jgi:hypothetical protein
MQFLIFKNWIQNNILWKQLSPDADPGVAQSCPLGSLILCCETIIGRREVEQPVQAANRDHATVYHKVTFTSNNWLLPKHRYT